MPALLSRTRVGRGGIVQVPVNEIDPNPNQPRRAFDGERLAALAESIAQYGVLSPITVRLRYGRYELIAGERRLRAARLAGLARVPCLVLDVDLEESGLLAMVENLQREDLDFVEEARGIENLIRLFDLSQEEAARRLGLSQSAVANKLRLLRLPPDILAALRDKGLTERHGRALLRLGSAEEQRAALAAVCEQGLNVAQTDAYIDALLAARKAGAPPRIHTQGCARLPQHPQPQPGAHEAGRHRRRNEARGDRGGAHRHHLYPEKVSRHGKKPPPYWGGLRA